MRSSHLLLLILFLLTVLLPLRCLAQKDPVFDNDDESLDELDLLDEDEDQKPVKKSEPKPTPTSTPTTPPVNIKIKTPSVPIVTEEDDDDVLIDEDEFVGYESTPPPKPKKEKSTNKPKTPPQVTLTLATPSSYWPEACAIILFLIYGLNYLWGRSRNDTIANRWLHTCNELFMIHFAATGIEDIHLLMETEEKQSVDEQFRAGHVAHHQRTSPILVKDSASCYKLYATGRRYCTGMLATIELRKRQDLFAWILAAVDMSTTQDTVTYEIPMSDEDMDPFVFAIVRKKHEKMIRKREKDLENYATLVKTSRLPATLCLLTDAPELESELIDDRVFRTLTDFEPYFISLHFSDQSPASFTTSRKVLRFTYRLPSDLNQMDVINKLTRMSLHFIDRIGSMKLTSGMRTRAEQKRKIVADRAYKATHQQRQEELLRRKAELKRKEEENAPPLTAEQQRRKEEREYKLQQKKMKPRVKMVR